METNSDKLPISVLVAGCNEANILDNCLRSISFCEDINYVDLDSTDNSIQIAEKFGANIIRHPKVPIVEIIREKYYRTLKYPWIIILDPDEEFDEELAKYIRKLFTEGIGENVAGVNFPWVFYFKNHRLKGTPWGGAKNRVFLMHKDRNILTDQVHSGRRIIEPNQDILIPFRGENIVHHYRMNGYKQLFEKHRRYLKHEPQIRYGLGKRTTLKSVLKPPYPLLDMHISVDAGIKTGTLAFSYPYSGCGTNRR